MTVRGDGPFVTCVFSRMFPISCGYRGPLKDCDGTLASCAERKKTDMRTKIKSMDWKTGVNPKEHDAIKQESTQDEQKRPVFTFLLIQRTRSTGDPSGYYGTNILMVRNGPDISCIRKDFAKHKQEYIDSRFSVYEGSKSDISGSEHSERHKVVMSEKFRNSHKLQKIKLEVHRWRVE